MHVPVLVKEMVDALNPRTSGWYLDGTLGAGGYARALLEASADEGRVIGLDLDPTAVKRAKERLAEFGERFHAVHAGFHEAREVLARLGISGVDGAVLDLGLSSDQLEDPARGFTFLHDGPLDMRFDTESGEPLSSFLGNIGRERLMEIIGEFGEERYSRRVARAILEARERGELRSVKDLARTIGDAIPGKRGRIHPATRTFQALRIAVNRELEHLDQALEDIPELLNGGARFCVVSYHSLEDRRVKQSFRARGAEKSRWRVLTKKPITPGEDEIRANPRARSAKMRVLEAAA